MDRQPERNIRDIVQTRRHVARKARAYLESHLAQDVKSKKDFSKNRSGSRKRENVG